MFGVPTKCCAANPRNGTCYDSDTCFWGCAEGYESVVKPRGLSAACGDFCCAVGSPGPFWYNACFFECPEGYKSILKSPTCWDLCVPIGQPYDFSELSHLPVDDCGRTELGSAFCH